MGKTIYQLSTYHISYVIGMTFYYLVTLCTADKPETREINEAISGDDFNALIFTSLFYFIALLVL